MLATSSPAWCMARAVRCFSGVHTVGRPPERPRARAAARPARVRSRIRSRSNSASAPNRLPTGGAGVDVLGQAHEGHAPLLQVGDRIDEVAQRPAEAIKAPHDHGVARPCLHEEVVEGRPGLEFAGGLVDEDAVAAGLGKASCWSASSCCKVLTRA